VPDVSRAIDQIYDRLVAEEKLKSGTKYERLAAIAFRALSGRTTVHDLRLRGESGVLHQIDAVVGDARKHVLIETKDYNRAVDLGVVRDFWGAVADIHPDEAFIVTTKGFSHQAQEYAAAMGIQLALLRPPLDEDWEGVIRRITLEITSTGQASAATIRWQVHHDDHDMVSSDAGRKQLTATAHLRLADASGAQREFLPIFTDQLHEDYGTVPLGGEQTIGRTNIFSEPTWLHAPGLQPLRVEAWVWELKVVSSTTSHVIGDATGDLVAELVLRAVDGSIHQMFTNKEIQSWTFDGHHLMPRTDRHPR
jgi:hypothetical protein